MTKIDDLNGKAVLITGASSGSVTGNIVRVNSGMYMP
jgi:hypothetical protein